MFYTYAHYKPDNTVFYIGKGKGMRAWNTKDRNPYWKNIVAKHGRPKVEVLCDWDTEEEAFQHEIILINCFKDMGYKLANITNGGDGTTGLKHTDEVKKIVSSVHKGKKLSDWHIERIKISQTGRKHSEKTIQHLRKINSGENNPMYGIGCMKGKKHTEETKRKLSEKKIGWKMSDEHKAILSATHKGKKQNPEQIKKRILARLATLEARKNLKKEG
jgi:hypothetical protein